MGGTGGNKRLVSVAGDSASARRGGWSVKVRLKLRGQDEGGGEEERSAAQQRETLKKMSKILMIQTSGQWRAVTVYKCFVTTLGGSNLCKVLVFVFSSKQ